MFSQILWITAVCWTCQECLISSGALPKSPQKFQAWFKPDCAGTGPDLSFIAAAELQNSIKESPRTLRMWMYNLLFLRWWRKTLPAVTFTLSLLYSTNNNSCTCTHHNVFVFTQKDTFRAISSITSILTCDCTLDLSTSTIMDWFLGFVRSAL